MKDFRVWCKDRKKMLYNIVVIDVLSKPSRVIGYVEGEKIGQVSNDFELMKNSGVADEDNIMIYEKDIVDAEGMKYEIKFKEGCFFFCGLDSKTEWDFNSHTIRSKQIKVIGNTYTYKK